MLAHLRNALVATGALLVLTTAAYPLVVTGIAQAAFPHQANGSLLHAADGHIVGSSLLAQGFNSTGYFHPRPSAAAYNAAASSGSNLGPSNPALADRVNRTVAGLRAAGDTSAGAVPADAATTSGSGLDPHITVANALSQVPRVAAARHLDEGIVRGLITAHTTPRGLGFLGEPAVNVLELNLALDRSDPVTGATEAQLAQGDPILFGVLGAVAVAAAVLLGSLLVGRLLNKTLGPTEHEPQQKAWWQVWRPGPDMGWKAYAAAFLVFNAVGILLTFLLLVFQDRLPLNPQHLPGVPWDLALNTAISFGTNTNWQAYAGEATMSTFSQMVALTFHNFTSAAVGLAAAFALIRGLARKDLRKVLGNFWTDLWRVTLFVLLPLALVFAVFLASQGVLQTFAGPVAATTVEGAQQTIVLGPVASQEAIKILGTNGGGFYNANSAHPFENPTALSNFAETVAILVIPGGLLFAFGRAILKPRHGHVLFAVCSLVLIASVTLIVAAEQGGNPSLAHLGVDQHATAFQAGGNMEGKEVRFGILATATFAGATTAVSCGAVNGMHDSFMPLGGMWPMVLIMLGELIFGGVGAGLYALIVLVVVSLFIAGLMTGRTPEYLQKKIGTFDIKMVMLSMLCAEIPILVGTAIALSLGTGKSSILNPGPHGLSEVLYAYASAVGNNGSAFAGLNANTLWYNLSLAAAMLIGRFAFLVPVFAFAGSMAPKQQRPETVATFPITGALFGGLLVGVILIVTALTFFPALVLGPILEHFRLGGA
jgi:K+-transporting ATPase ATPase A chain